MKRVFCIGAISFILVLAVLAIGISMKSGSVNLDDQTSYFMDYSIAGEHVYIFCSVTVVNSSSADRSFTLSATMPEDVKIGLLKQEAVCALREDGTEATFFLRGNSRQTFSVMFVGEFAGINCKHDRLLPYIMVHTLG